MRRITSGFVTALVLLLTAAPALAQFRDLQVPIQGNSLQQVLNGFGQAIDVDTEQLALQVFSGIFLTRPAANIHASLAAGAGALSLYNVTPVGPELFRILPSPLPPGWHAWVICGTPPTGATVHLFDKAVLLPGSVVHTGINLFAMGFAVTDAQGTFYMEDARNAGGAAHVLGFKGTGVHMSETWLAVETDGDGDFVDALFLVQGAEIVPVHRASWGAVKQRFR